MKNDRRMTVVNMSKTLRLQEIGDRLEHRIPFAPGQDVLGQNLAQLHPFLVERVEVPDEALEHHFVLEVGKQRSQRLWGELLPGQQRRTPVSLELLVGVLVILASGKRDDLGGQVGIEFLLAGRSLDGDVLPPLVLMEADELQWDDVRSLMEPTGRTSAAPLVPGSPKITVRGVAHLLSRAIDVLSVAFHIQLLQMGREADQTPGNRGGSP